MVMTRTPDDVKKGLECCQDYQSCTEFGEPKCPYNDVKECVDTLLADALALIQQLQAENAEKDQRIRQLEAERDAAVADVRLAYTSYVGACQTCEHVKDQVDCDNPLGCRRCGEDKCKCNTCNNDYSNWEWRGVQREE